MVWLVQSKISNGKLWNMEKCVNSPYKKQPSTQDFVPSCGLMKNAEYWNFVQNSGCSYNAEYGHVMNIWCDKYLLPTDSRKVFICHDYISKGLQYWSCVTRTALRHYRRIKQCSAHHMAWPSLHKHLLLWYKHRFIFRKNLRGSQFPKILYKILNLRLRDCSLAKKIHAGTYHL